MPTVVQPGPIIAEPKTSAPGAEKASPHGEKSFATVLENAVHAEHPVPGKKTAEKGCAGKSGSEASESANGVPGTPAAATAAKPVVELTAAAAAVIPVVNPTPVETSASEPETTSSQQNEAVAVVAPAAAEKVITRATTLPHPAIPAALSQASVVIAVSTSDASAAAPKQKAAAVENPAPASGKQASLSDSVSDIVDEDIAVSSDPLVITSQAMTSAEKQPSPKASPVEPSAGATPTLPAAAKPLENLENVVALPAVAAPAPIAPKANAAPPVAAPVVNTPAAKTAGTKKDVQNERRDASTEPIPDAPPAPEQKIDLGSSAMPVRRIAAASPGHESRAITHAGSDHPSIAARSEMRTDPADETSVKPDAAQTASPVRSHLPAEEMPPAEHPDAADHNRSSEVAVANTTPARSAAVEAPSPAPPAASLVSHAATPPVSSDAPAGGPRATAHAAPPAAEPLPSAPAMGGPVQTARLLDRMGQSEMHIGLRTLAFGAVEVHTAVRGGEVGLAVGSEKGDLRGWLAPEVPALEGTLRQHELRLETVRFLQPAFDGHTGSFARGSSHEHPASPGYQAPAGSGVFEEPRRAGSALETALEVRSGLDVRA